MVNKLYPENKFVNTLVNEFGMKDLACKLFANELLYRFTKFVYVNELVNNQQFGHTFRLGGGS